MRYAEYDPPDSLAHILHCVWTFEDDAAHAEPQRIVPDGRCELVVHFGAPYREAGSRKPQPRVVFAGQLTRPLWIEATGPSGVVGARFHPATARAFLGLPMGVATDRRLDASEVWPGAGELAHAIRAGVTSEARRDAVLDFVARHCARDEPDPVIAAAVSEMQEVGGVITVDEVAVGTGLGRRQLERRFLDAVGVSPALFANILRFRRVFDAIEHDSARPWTDAAATAGYFDQSHLIRDFRRFVGCTPTEFAASQPGLARALVEDVAIFQARTGARH
jgi:AraC-like DNA-binding protein